MTIKGIVLVAQLGSRMHYAVPISLFRLSLLGVLVTDITSLSAPARLLQGVLPPRLRPRFVKRLIGRTPGNISSNLIKEFPLFGFWIAFLRSAAQIVGLEDRVVVYVGQAFARRSSAQLTSTIKCVYSFDSASLELFRSIKDSSVLKILEQTMAPRLTEDHFLRRANELYPDWAKDKILQNISAREALYHREASEWKEADIIVCGSQFVVDGIKHAGGPADKCVVVPYAIDQQRVASYPRKLNRKRPIRILFVGSVNLRKGIPVVYDAAKCLCGLAEFRIVGPISISKFGERRLREVAIVTGSIPRSEIAEQYAWADLFVLPSVCEGSATVTYEAMASGLPQIVTENAGSYVSHLVEGVIIPIFDSAALVDAIKYYANDPVAYQTASAAALSKASTLTIEHYGDRLSRIINTHKTRK